jgi:hypothetical protein
VEQPTSNSHSKEGDPHVQKGSLMAFIIGLE